MYLLKMMGIIEKLYTGWPRQARLPLIDKIKKERNT
jgi:hypothetical protein